MEDKYYVVAGDIRLSLYDNSNDSMIPIAATQDKSKWVRLSFEEAENLKRSIG